MKTLKFNRQFAHTLNERQEARYLEGRTYSVNDEVAKAALAAKAADEVPAETAPAAKKGG